ncbi:hypothetical protein CL656_02355 [bacterium]|nr:hypothetical protein [bacterium]|tara:strand:- start:8568 stop:9668 length:1101 start_codon:yes stop_codon:yes gene_type:complete
MSLSIPNSVFPSALSNKKDYSLVIPDVHGSVLSLNETLFNTEKFVFEEGFNLNDIIFLGDFVDRGRYSMEVIEQVLDLRRNYNVITLMGNHEAIMLRALVTKDFNNIFAWIFNGGFKTLVSLAKHICPLFESLLLEMSKIFKTGFKRSHKDSFFDFFVQNYSDFVSMFDEILADPKIISFLSHLQLSHYEDGNLFIHGGIDSNFIESRSFTVENWLEEMSLEFSNALQMALDGDFTLFNSYDTVSKSSGGTQKASPFWFRNKDFTGLSQVELLITEDYFKVAGIDRLIVGHCVVDEIKRFKFPGGTSVWFTDVGMSEAYSTFFEQGGILIPKKLSSTKSKVFESEVYYIDSFGFYSSLTNVVALES